MLKPHRLTYIAAVVAGSAVLLVGRASADAPIHKPAARTEVPKAVSPATARCSKDGDAWDCHNDRTTWDPQESKWSTPVFCHAREDWSDLCGWLVSDPSWFSYRCYGGTVTNGPESGSYSAWLNTEADYTKVGSNGPWGWVSDAWISDDTTNVPGEWPQCDIYT